MNDLEQAKPDLTKSENLDLAKVEADGSSTKVTVDPQEIICEVAVKPDIETFHHEQSLGLERVTKVE